MYNNYIRSTSHRSWTKLYVPESISGQHNYLTSTLPKSYQLHTPSINSENNYRTSNQLDSTQRLRRASIPLRLSSFSIENLKATTITLKTPSYENLTIVKTLCPCLRVRKKEVVLYSEFYLQPSI